MKLTKQRIFIKNLPETATQDEIRQIFSHYGNVLSIEIKERKQDANLKNLSLFFSYINIEIDDKNLQKCFQDFQSEQWHNQYVELQIAKENFLEKLKREREEFATNGTSNHIEDEAKAPVIERKIVNGVKKKVVESSSSSSSESESEEEEKTAKPAVKIAPETKNAKESDSSSSSSEDEEEPEEKLDLVIKNNKYKKIDKNGLKIESVGKEPILVIDQTKKKVKAANAEALKQMQKEYQGRQSAIKAALASIDKQPKNKIVFDDDNVGISHLNQNKAKNAPNNKKRTNKNLFDDDEGASDGETYDFNVKSQFEGARGQKLLELQSKFKHDSRFRLDERFLDEEQQQEENGGYEEELTLEEEKRREYEILGQVLGKKVTPYQQSNKETDQQRKFGGMIRYDPSQPEHSKYVVKHDEFHNKKDSKRKRKTSENDDAENLPEVSKEVFYNVSENLKDTFQEEKEGFSLLKMFGRNEERSEKSQNDEGQAINLPKKSKLGVDSNPFRYDSSDDEAGEEKTNENEQKDKEQVAPIKMWTEPFFFTDDDYRLQEGHDFILKMAGKERTSEDFSKLRREIKQVVKGKVRHLQRKNKPFKKKLGGNKRKRINKMKKTMKR